MENSSSISLQNKIAKKIPKFFLSLAFKGTMLLFSLLLIFALIIYYYSEGEARRFELQSSEKLARQVGSNLINSLSVKFSAVELITHGQATIATVSKDSPIEYVTKMAEYFDVNEEQNIISGGYWSTVGHEIGKTTNAVVWEKNSLEMLEYRDKYENDTVYRNANWFRLAKYQKPKRCFWSSPTNSDKMQKIRLKCTVFSRKEGEIIGVASTEIDLSDLAVLAKKAAQITGGYVMFIDRKKHFITIGNSNHSVKQISVDETATFSDFVEKHPEFKLVENAVGAYDNKIIRQVNRNLGHQFERLVASLQTDVPELSDEAAKLEIAYANITKNQSYDEKNDVFFATAYLKPNDFVADNPSRGYVFNVPKTHWKMVIVVSEEEATIIAGNISKALLSSLLIIATLLAIICYYLLEFEIFYRLKTTLRALTSASELVEAQKVSELKNIKIITNNGNDEVSKVANSVIVLLDRVIANDNELSAINATLEDKVERRTNKLTKTLRELKLSQDHLIQSEKMSLLGQMVAGVAHEVNTPLGYLKNNILLCQRIMFNYDVLFELIGKFHASGELYHSNNDEQVTLVTDMKKIIDNIKEDQSDEDVREMLSDSLFGIEQISELVFSLKDFAKLNSDSLKHVNIHHCISNSLKMLDIRRKGTIVTKDFCESLPEIYCSPSQIRQVIINLIDNAISAMEIDGVLTVTTGARDGYVFIEIKDNGSGMSEETLENIFEPFFTTAAAGKGTGLGLAIVKRIVDEHYGKIEVSSKQGEGTRFTVYLPIVYTLNRIINQ